MKRPEDPGARNGKPAYHQIVNSHVIIQDPEVLGGEPIFAGTRVPVKSLFDHLEAGDSIEDFLDGFPSVRREQIITLLEEARARVLAGASQAK